MLRYYFQKTRQIQGSWLAAQLSQPIRSLKHFFKNPKKQQYHPTRFFGKTGIVKS